MDPNSPETLAALSHYFLQSLSPSAADRSAAESSLTAASSSPYFAIALLRLASSDAFPPESRLAAAVHFKNLLRTRWPPDSSSPLAPETRNNIKTLLLPLLLNSPPRIQPQLSESLAVVAASDFPNNWPTLLPDIVREMATTSDYTRINSLLTAANSLFLRFRIAYDTTDLRLALKYCLDGFASPLLEVSTATSRRIAAASNPSLESISPLLEAQRLCCEIFRSLNSVELPEFFEDHMREWMAEFRAYLVTNYPADVEASGAPDALRAAICDNLQLYMEKNEEEFKDYLKDFVTAVWGLLMTPSPSPTRNQLAVTAIRFLTTVAESVHHALFGSAEAMQQICDSVVLPNLRLKDEDEELFEMNYMEYVRRDTEGIDADTLRRAACRLLRGLAVNYREQVTALVSAQVQRMLLAYNAHPVENWKEKDAAIYLVIALTQKPAATGGTSAGGGAYIVDVESFFSSVIVPELQAADWGAAPMLKAGALRFLKEFREQIPKNAAISLLPSVIRFLGHESNVVHSYAAICIESLLAVKDRVPGPQGNGFVTTLRYGSTDVTPFAPQLITGLFNALHMPDSQENPYLMKCLMRVLAVANVAGDYAPGCVVRLVGILNEVCNNPRNPEFNHSLFESIAAVIGRSGEQDPALLPVFEGSLFPVLQRILVDDISEFWSYAFQIFAQLIRLRNPPISPNYMQLFLVLLNPESWQRPGSAPPLVLLLRAFLQKIPNDLNQEGRLVQILNISGNLVSNKKTEDSGFFVLNALAENLPYDVIAPHLRNIWTALFTQLQSRQVPKFVNSVVIFMCLVLVKYGPGVLVESMNTVQQGIFTMILKQFWIPNLKLITGRLELKLAVVASTRLICESPVLLDPAEVQTWGRMLDSIVTLLTKSDPNGPDDNGEDDAQKPTGYSVSFARLRYAEQRERDLLTEISDPKQFVVTSLAGLAAQFPGRFGPIIEQCVDPANKSALLQLCASYNVAIV